MRLLYRDGDGKFCLKFILPDDIASYPYAILSHTWSTDFEEEVTFRDLSGDTRRDKAIYDKLHFCADQAMRDGLSYFWIDTCCIDKSDQNELSEAINSMFRWYHNADRCYVHLSDVSAASNAQADSEDLLQYTEASADPPWEAAFRTSRWFTRGWTLQELLAPPSVEFFTQDRQRLGDKRSLERKIHQITGIPVLALRQSSGSFTRFGIQERFEWVDNRQTTREEDIAYCLLGIFDISMPLIYGEGKKRAMRRLRKAIGKSQPIFSFMSTR
jgi:Heterokaryon incompatibility protein (HET)